MEWAARVPAPPAIEAGEGCQRQGVKPSCHNSCDAYPTSELGRSRLRLPALALPDVRYASLSDQSFAALDWSRRTIMRHWRQAHNANSSSKACASIKSSVSKPSVNRL